VITHRARQQERVVEIVRRFPGHAAAYRHNALYHEGVPCLGVRDYGADAPGPTWLRNRLGRHYFDRLAAVGLWHTFGARPTDAEAVELVACLEDVPSCVYLRLDCHDLTPAAVVPIGRLGQLERLTLSDVRMPDKYLSFFAQLDRLRWLEISGSRYCGEFLHHLAGAERLTRLSLHGHNLSDDGLRRLSELARLRQLLIWKGQATDRMLQNLRPLNKLETLTLREARFTTLDSLPPLAITSLSLDVIGQECDLEGLGRLSRLESLRLSGSAIRDEQLVHLRSLGRLKRLRLCSTEIDGRGLEHLLALPQLEALDLGNTCVEPQYLELLADHPGLKSMNLANTPIERQCRWRCLRGFHALKDLRIMIDDRQLAEFSRMLPGCAVDNLE
jgi:hypothetical protein